MIWAASPAAAAPAKEKAPAVRLSARAVKAVPLGGSAKLELSAKGAENPSYTFEVEGEGNGSVDADGTYHAPASHKTPATINVRVSAEGAAPLKVAVPLAAISLSAKATSSTVPLGGETQIDAKLGGASESAAGVKFEVSGGGTIDDKGHYTAPAQGKTPAKITVKVTSVADPSKSASVPLSLATVAISLKAPSKPVPVGGAIDLEAKLSGATGAAAALTWSVVGEGHGSIDDKGHFTAPETFKTPGSITVKVTSVADPSKSASAAIPIAAVAVSLKAPGKPVPVGGAVDLDAKVAGAIEKSSALTWSVVGEGHGTVDEKGHFTAPESFKTPGTVSVKVVPAGDPSKAVTVGVPIAAVAVALKPPSKPVPVGGAIDLDAKVAGAIEKSAVLTWSVVGEGHGSVDEKGHFTAPETFKTPGSISVKAVPAGDPSKAVTVAIPIAAVAVSAKPVSATVPLGGDTQINASVSGTTGNATGLKFEVSGGGSIDEKGHYTAPVQAKTPAKITVKVTPAADPSKAVSVPMNLAAVELALKAPPKPVLVGGSVDLDARISGATGSAAGINWSVLGEGHGTIDEKGHYTAPAVFKTPGTVTVKVTSAADPSKSASVAVPIAAVSVAISPKQAELELGGEASFTAQVAGADASAQSVTWAVVGGDKDGSIDEKGHYVAPLQHATPAKVTIKATALADPSKSSTITVSYAAVRVTTRAPATPLALGGVAQLEAALSGATGKASGVTWKVESTGGGTVDASGVYHAPEKMKTPATVTVRATSDADPSKSTTLALAFPAVTVTLPARSYPIELGGELNLSATVTGATGAAGAVQWTVETPKAGTIDASGHYRSPLQLETPKVVTVRATSVADETKSATLELDFAKLEIAASPKSAEVPLGAKASFQAEIAHATGDAKKIAWSVMGGDANGTVDADGTYHAPAQGKTPAKAKIRATAVADPSKTVEVEVAWPEVKVGVDPAQAHAPLGSSVALHPKVENAVETGVEYAVSANGGRVEADGTYRAPELLPEPPRAQITIHPKADPSKAVVATVDLSIAGSYSIAGDLRISGGQPGAIAADLPARQRLALDEPRVLAAYGDGSALLIATSEDRGRSFRSPLKLLSGKFPVAGPALVLGSDHTLWVAFRAQPKSQPADLMVCRTPDLQHAFDPCVRANKSPLSAPGEHALAVAPNGAVLVAWIDGDQVVLAKSANRGVSFSTQSFPAPGAHGLSLALAPDGTTFLAFAARGSGGDALTVLSGQDALAPFAGLSAGGAHLESPSLAVRSASQAAVAYVADGQVRVQVSGGSTVTVGAEGGATQDAPALALDGPGLQLAFRDRRASGVSIRLSRAPGAFTGTLSFAPPMEVTTPGPATRGAPSLAVDRSGRAVIAWPDGRGADAQGKHQDLYFARADEHPTQLRVTAPSKPLLAGQTARLSAEVIGSEAHEVRWSVDDGPGRGAVDAQGVYTAPEHLTGSAHVYVRATSVADPTRSAAALVELAPQPEISSFGPDRAGVGELVTVLGAHFGARYPGFGVSFGGVRAHESDYVSWEDDKIEVRLPPHAKSGELTVTATGGTARAERDFTFLPVTVSVAPQYAVVYAGESKPFKATVLHAGDTRVTWRLDDPKAGNVAESGVLSVDASATQVRHTRIHASSVAEPESSSSGEVVTGPVGGEVWHAKLQGAHGPVLAKDVALVTDAEGNLRAFDAQGREKWYVPIVSVLGSEGVPPQLRTPLVVGENAVVVVQNSGSCAQGRACLPDTGELVAVRIKDGQLLWRTELGEGDFTDPVAFKDRLAVARYAGALNAFSPDNGKKLWTVALPKGLSTAPVFGPDGLLRGSAEGGVVYAVTPAGKALPTVTLPGKPSSVSSPSVAADGTLYVSTDDNKLRALSSRGQALWTADLGGRVPSRTNSAPLLGSDGHLYVATSTTLEAFDNTGRKLWQGTCAACSGPLLQGPDGNLYAGRYAPQAFSRDGRFLWGATAPTIGERWSPAVISDAGLLLWTDSTGLGARIVTGVVPAPLADAASVPGRQVSAK